MFDLFRQAGSSEGVSRKELRPHQVRALDLLRQSLRLGNRRVVLEAVVGFGKTLCAARIIEGAIAKGNRVIFTAPMISLIDQTVKAFEAEGIQHIGVMQANHPRTDPTAPVQVCSVQTLARRDVPAAAVIVVDEAHIRSQVIEDLMASRPDVVFIGLTATPWSKGMGLHWQALVTPCTVSELIEGGFLSQFRVFAPDVPDLSRVRVERGDYAEAALASIMGEAQLVGNVVQTWLEKGEDRPTLAFGVNRAHAKAIHAAFERAGVASAYVDAMVDSPERGHIGRLFRAGEVRVICSVRTMTTGVDLPVSCIIDAAPTRSAALHMQKIGRGLRVNPGTEDLLVLDHAGNSLRIGLVTDLEPRPLDKTKPGERAPAEPKAEKLPKPCPKCAVLFTGALCPGCGHERQAPRIAEADGELVELVGKSGKKPAATMAEKDRFWRMALWVDADRGKSGRLAKALYKGRFDCWPRGLSNEPMRPDQAFWHYEKSRRIAYARGKANAEGRS